MRSPVGLNQWRLHWLTLLQDLVRLAQFTDLALQILDAILLSAGQASALAAIAFGLLTPDPQTVRRTPKLGRNRPVRGAIAAVIGAVLTKQANSGLNKGFRLVS